MMASFYLTMNVVIQYTFLFGVAAWEVEGKFLT